MTKRIWKAIFQIGTILKNFPTITKNFFFLEFPVYHVDIWNITLTIQNNFDGFSLTYKKYFKKDLNLKSSKTFEERLLNRKYFRGFFCVSQNNLLNSIFMILSMLREGIFGGQPSKSNFSSRLWQTYQWPGLEKKMFLYRLWQMHLVVFSLLMTNLSEEWSYELKQYLLVYLSLW